MSYTPDILRFNGRIQRDSNTTISLREYKGNSCYVSGEYVYPGAGGISLVTTDNLINSTGGDAASAMASGTVYNIYISNSKATTFPSDLRASTTAPSLVAGVKYLGTSGNALNWRFVGWVRTNSSTEFVNTEASRDVVNYYNRIWVKGRANPAYVDDNALTTYTFASTNWGAANGGTGNQIAFIGNGEDVVRSVATLVGDHDSAAANMSVGIGHSSSTQPESEATQSVAVADELISCTCSDAFNVPAAGVFHSLNLLLLTSDTTTFTIAADVGRSGAAADVRSTQIEAMIPI